MNNHFDQKNSISYFTNMISDDPNNLSACIQAEKFAKQYGKNDKRYQIHLNHCQSCQEKDKNDSGIID